MSTASPALIIFARNPVLGRVKTRLAGSIGNEAALRVYNRLLQHTLQATLPVSCSRFVYYDDVVSEPDIWPPEQYQKRVQHGNNLGRRMYHAFEAVLQAHNKAVIIGTDCYGLLPQHITSAFAQLEECDVVLGPAADGGYYLLGMKALHQRLFEQIEWSSEKVLAQTLAQIEHLRLRHALLEVLHDVDTADDLGRYPGLL